MDIWYNNAWITLDVYDYRDWTPDLDVMDDIVFLADPPEYYLPEWDRAVEPYPWETHDYTMDYDYPDDWTYTDEEEDE